MGKSPKKSETQLEPDAWPHFERFIREIAKAAPQHRKAKSTAKPKKRKVAIVSVSKA
jgi:hypothetical protein